MSNRKENTKRPAIEPLTPASTYQQPPARVPWLIIAATAIIAVIGVNGWSRWVAASAERDLLAVEVDSLKHQLQEVRTNVPLDDLRIYSLESIPDDDKKAGIIWSQSLQKGVLEIFNLPPTPNNQPYELWIEDANGKQPISGGTFVISKEGRFRLPFSPKATLENPVGFKLMRGDQTIISS